MGKRRGAGKNRGKGRKIMTVTEESDEADQQQQYHHPAQPELQADAPQPPPKKKTKRDPAAETASGGAAAAAAAVPIKFDAAAAAAAAPFFERAKRFAVAPVGSQEPASLEELRKPVKQTLDPERDGPVLPARNILAYLDSAAERDSGVLARQLMTWLIQPVPAAKFISKCWERRCMLLRRSSGLNYYDGLFSMRELRKILSQSPLQYGTDLDITQYSVETGRKTMNASGLAQPDTVWRAFEKSGFSLRFTRPHVHHRGLWQLLAQLEEFFGCGVCVNAYATPSAVDNTTPRQGFAAQFSEVEVFVLQIEGEAHWQLYAPTSVDALHPRRPSPDLHQKALGEPFMDVTLRAGDLLYIPSGVIFQTRNLSTSEPALELRLSTGAGMTYRDLIAAALPRALDIASAEEATLRRKLPHDFLSYMGVSYSSGGDVVTAPPVGLPPSLREEYSTRAVDSLKEREAARSAFQTQLDGLTKKVLNVLPLDTAADQLAKQQLTDFRLPPAFSTNQLKGCHHGQGVKEKLAINEERSVINPNPNPHPALPYPRRHPRVSTASHSCLELVQADHGWRSLTAAGCVSLLVDRCASAWKRTPPMHPRATRRPAPSTTALITQQRARSSTLAARSTRSGACSSRSSLPLRSTTSSRPIRSTCRWLSCQRLRRLMKRWSWPGHFLSWALCTCVPRTTKSRSSRSRSRSRSRSSNSSSRRRSAGLLGNGMQ